MCIELVETMQLYVEEPNFIMAKLGVYKDLEKNCRDY